MPLGKATAKAIQAAVNSFHRSSPEIQSSYLRDGEGTQIVLVAPDEVAMRAAYNDAWARGLPCVLYPEALGIGPCIRECVEDIVAQFPLYGVTA